jgi:uroporphyrinogen-III synthase
MARVLVTRAEPGASATARRLAAAGHDAVVEPMLIIEPLDAPMPTDDAQALLFTSAAGVRAFASRSDRRSAPVLCVGEATARAALSFGFSDVRAADGDGAALSEMALASLDPAKGPLAHIAGEDVAFDVAGALRAKGFIVNRITAYRARAATALSEGLFARPLDAVLFHSARAADAFLALAPKAPLAAIDALCLSPRVAARLTAQSWRSVRVAPEPREPLLLALLQKRDSAQS